MILAPEAPLRKETSTEIIFGHRPLVGWFYICVGTAMSYAGINRHIGSGVNYLISGVLMIFGITILVAGIAGALKRLEILIDLLSRTYVIKKGYYPSTRIWKGFLTDLNALVVDTRTDSGANYRTISIWRISLDFKNMREPISIIEHPVKEKAYEKLESLAKKLHVPVHDRTEVADVVVMKD